MSPGPGRPPIADDELLAELQRVADELGHKPTATEMKKRGAYSVATYRNRYGTWSSALREAGLC